MTLALPIKLNKEPLIDAVFEVRFASAVPASVILPGLLFNKLDGEKVIERTPVGQLSKTVRDADHDLKFAPLSNIDWNNFFIGISDFSVSISCKYPYAGWLNFKPAIIQVVNTLAESKIVEAIERYSIRYVDMIPTSGIQEKVSMINFVVTIAGHKLEKECFQFRIEIPKDGLTNAVNIVSPALVVLHDGTKKEGLIVDVDTFVIQNNISMESLLEGFQDKLDSIHLINKRMFFDCITPQTTELLEPVYE